MPATPAGGSGRSPAATATLVAVPAALVAGVLVFWLLGGFGSGPPRAAGSAEVAGPVEVTAPPPASAQARAICRTLLAALPDTLDGRGRRPVRTTAGHPTAGHAAAWGDPPVVLRCGTGPPPSGPDEVGVNGVFWTPVTAGDETVWTTRGRSVTVEVRVPAAHAEESGQHIINPLTGPISATVPLAR